MEFLDTKSGRSWNYEEKPSQTILQNKDKLSTKGKKVHSCKTIKRKKKSLMKSEKRLISVPKIPVTQLLSLIPGQKVAESAPAKPHIEVWILPLRKDPQELTRNKSRETQGSEDDQTEIISWHVEDDAEKKISLPDLFLSQVNLINEEIDGEFQGQRKADLERQDIQHDTITKKMVEFEGQSLLPEWKDQDSQPTTSSTKKMGEFESQSLLPEWKDQDSQPTTSSTDKKEKNEPSGISDVIPSITSLIKQLDLDRVVEISIDDLLKDTKEVSLTSAWTDVSTKTVPFSKLLQQNKISGLLKDKKDGAKSSQMDVVQEPSPPRKKFDILKDGRENQGKHNSSYTSKAKKSPSFPFHKKATEQVFPKEKKQASSLKCFTIKQQVKTPQLDRKNCFRDRHFPPLILGRKWK
ncbi:uncharacterized protein CCDC7 isoform X2 [Antechinus flavipes]|uniref:uncharacterized protein CCDC7 isoform X2 n=1 Tax=Antechinus flavipes TaxID=38775 RepID=UPI002235A8EC|nr:uncharacterized protein CCDC7 isoform X2 [Antechinus flavipes]